MAKRTVSTKQNQSNYTIGEIVGALYADGETPMNNDVLAELVDLHEYLERLPTLAPHLRVSWVFDDLVEDGRQRRHRRARRAQRAQRVVRAARRRA